LLNFSGHVVLAVNDKENVVSRTILKLASATIKEMIDGDEGAKIPVKVDEQIEPFMIYYLSTAECDKEALLENPELVPLVICEALKLQADILLDFIENLFLKERCFLKKVSRSSFFHEDFIPIHFVYERLSKPHVVKTSTDIKLKCCGCDSSLSSYAAGRCKCHYCDRNFRHETTKVKVTLHASDQLYAFDQWLRKSSVSKQNQFFKNLRKGSY